MFDRLQWTQLKRPGYFGKHRDRIHATYDQEYGAGNWAIGWVAGPLRLEFPEAAMLYEDAYHSFLNNNPSVLAQLVRAASNVYDDAPSNVQSGFDYSVQETKRTHLQDIAIRRSLIRIGVWFWGKELVQIRDKEGTHPLSLTLSPGRVPFHLPELIARPELEGWWEPGSVESFYQSNKVLQIKAASVS